MKILHVVPEINEANGVYQVARLLAREDGGELIDCLACSIVRLRDGRYDEVWVHGMWLPSEWKACWLSLQLGKRLVRMTHGSLSPIYLERQGKWKKRIVGPIERWLLRRADRVVATCEAEKRWIEAYEPRVRRVELMELKRFFRLEGRGNAIGGNCFCVSLTSGTDSASPLHVLYVGRRHPLKGVEYLERAVAELGEGGSLSQTVELRIVSNHFGEELEKDWAWCDVLCLPTLSENFGLVVAEALERGKRVVTTDGAPAWEPPPIAAEVKVRGEGEPWRDRIIFLKGYRDGTDAERVRLLKEAIGILI